jgi:hypothetical protein
MNKIWALLANTGGDLVLSGHLHDMEESYPLTAAKQPGSGAHMVQLISGAGGHLLRQNQSGAPIVWQKQGTPGALYLTPSGSGGPATQISWTFQDTSGHSLRTGSVNC